MNKCCAQSLQSCLMLCNPLDCSPSGSSVHRLLQGRILEWVNARETKEHPTIAWSQCRMLGRQTRGCKELSLVGCSDWEAVMTTRTEVQRPERTKGTGPSLDREYSRTQRKRWALICTQPTSLWWQINLHRAPFTDAPLWTGDMHLGGLLTLSRPRPLSMLTPAQLLCTPPPIPISRRAQPCHKAMSLFSQLYRGIIDKIMCVHIYIWASLVAQMVMNLPAMWETWVRSLGLEDPQEEGMTIDSSILAWWAPMDRGA